MPPIQRALGVGSGIPNSPPIPLFPTHRTPGAHRAERVPYIIQCPAKPRRRAKPQHRQRPGTSLSPQHQAKPRHQAKTLGEKGGGRAPLGTQSHGWWWLGWRGMLCPWGSCAAPRGPPMYIHILCIFIFMNPAAYALKSYHQNSNAIV